MGIRVASPVSAQGHSAAQGPRSRLAAPSRVTSDVVHSGCVTLAVPAVMHRRPLFFGEHLYRLMRTPEAASDPVDPKIPSRLNPLADDDVWHEPVPGRPSVLNGGTAHLTFKRWDGHPTRVRKGGTAAGDHHGPRWLVSYGSCAVYWASLPLTFGSRIAAS
jgi:hypothetical protein